MKVSLPAMSRAIDGLYERGFVDRQEDPLDRRMKRLSLTEAGRAITSSLNETRLATMQEFLVSLSDEEAQALDPGARADPRQPRRDRRPATAAKRRPS